MSRKRKEPKPAWPEDPTTDPMYPFPPAMFQNASSDTLDRAVQVGLNSSHPMASPIFRGAADELHRRLSMGQFRRSYGAAAEEDDDE